jgi:hypothetical protein
VTSASLGSPAYLASNKESAYHKSTVQSLCKKRQRFTGVMSTFSILSHTLVCSLHEQQENLLRGGLKLASNSCSQIVKLRVRRSHLDITALPQKQSVQVHCQLIPVSLCLLDHIGLSKLDVIPVHTLRDPICAHDRIIELERHQLELVKTRTQGLSDGSGDTDPKYYCCGEYFVFSLGSSSKRLQIVILQITLVEWTILHHSPPSMLLFRTFSAVLHGQLWRFPHRFQTECRRRLSLGLNRKGHLLFAHRIFAVIRP